MKAVLMAGGEGTRLRPLTSNLPKPMVQVANKPIMEHIIEHLAKHKITDIVATLQYLPQVIKSYFAEGEELGIDLSYAIEEFPLGTAGSVKNTAAYLNETFVVISGDALTDIDLNKAIEFHKKRKAMATITLKRVDNPLEFGIVITEKDGRIVRFLEKPSWGEVFSDTINTGIYILEPSIFEHIPSDCPYDFSKELFPDLLAKGFPLYGYVADGYWCDIGDIGQYIQAQRDILDGKVKVNIPGIKTRSGIWVGEGASIDPNSKIEGPAIIGHDSKVEAGASVGKYSVIGNNAIIRGHARIDRALVGENTYIENNVSLRGCIVGKNCDIRGSARLEEGAVLGDDCLVGERAVINNNVKVYPFKVIDGGSTVTRSVIWESKGTRTLFGKKGVAGIINIDITPDMAARLAMAYGSTLDKGSQVAVSRDSSRPSRMIKRAIVAGLSSAAVHCRDLRTAPTPINRFTVRSGRLDGGIHIQVSPLEPQVVEINFFDTNGVDISESEQRKIERIYYREDFRRSFHNEVGETIFPTLTYEYYGQSILKKLDKKLIKKRRHRVVLDYFYGNASLVCPQLIGKLGCEVISLNAFTDEDRTSVSVSDFEAFIMQLGQTVKSFNADFGALIDSTCERLIVVDDKGKRIGYDYLLLILVDLMCRFGQKGKIAVPVTVSTAVEKIAEKYGRTVLRTRLNPTDLMTTALKKDVVFAGAQGGRFIFSRMNPFYDAIQTLVMLIEFLSKANEPISKIEAGLPAYHLAQRDLFCAWENKGLVMRKLLEESAKKEVDLTDGIKIFDETGWTLLIPDSVEPLCRIFSEGASKRDAEVKIDKYAGMIEEFFPK
ncbi:MAG: mannose-1-phosphate guanyltransferase [Actinomycetota bacterium]|nr:mannose-1-phosphate guanyltransferase [Actinomycetota bacterium]